MNYQDAYKKLTNYGQLHVFNHYNDLNFKEQEELLSQIDVTDFSVLNFLNGYSPTDKGKIEPLVALQIYEINKNKNEYMNVGLSAIRSGKVAAVLLAGGMGTRLGSDSPKGMFNIGVTKDLYIFECLINNLLEIVKMSGTWIHLFIMTSDKNNETTINFFKAKNFFGYNSNYVSFFVQEITPTTDFNGHIYMEAKNRISTSPNGNGGWYKSIVNSNINEIIKCEGIEWLNVFAVDNVLQKIADPYFIGATIMSKCNAGAKVIKKNAIDEKVGVICLANGKPSVIEYYEMTDELLYAKDKSGSPLYNYGVILNYLFNTRKLDEISKRELPVHIVKKKISYLNETGQLITPLEPNGYKFETLVLDLVQFMDSCLPYEVIREKEFAPIKNKVGIDSIESARTLLKENGILL